MRPYRRANLKSLKNIPQSIDGTYLKVSVVECLVGQMAEASPIQIQRLCTTTKAELQATISPDPYALVLKFVLPAQLNFCARPARSAYQRRSLHHQYQHLRDENTPQLFLPSVLQSASLHSDSAQKSEQNNPVETKLTVAEAQYRRVETKLIYVEIAVQDFSSVTFNPPGISGPKPAQGAGYQAHVSPLHNFSSVTPSGSSKTGFTIPKTPGSKRPQHVITLTGKFSSKCGFLRYQRLPGASSNLSSRSMS